MLVLITPAKMIGNRINGGETDVCVFGTISR